MESKLTCPNCGSENVTVTEEAMWMVNTMTVTLDAFTVAFLELLGNGNLSRGIREAARKLAPKKTMKTGETHEH